jgi:hypothetical protein
MNRAWIVVGIFAIAGAVVFQSTRPSQNSAAAPKSSEPIEVTEEIEILMRSLQESQGMRDAGMWANCDPASTYPRKDPNKCNVTHVEIAVED